MFIVVAPDGREYRVTEIGSSVPIVTRDKRPANIQGPREMMTAEGFPVTQVSDEEYEIQPPPPLGGPIRARRKR